MKVLIDTETDYDENGELTPRVASVLECLGVCPADVPAPVRVLDTPATVPTSAPVVSAPVEVPYGQAPTQAVVENPPTKPKKGRRSKAEIQADDDAACLAEIKAAKNEGRQPDWLNLPADVRRRVGKKPQSWIDPQEYAAIMSGPVAVPPPAVEPEEPPVVAPAVDPTPAAGETPSGMDFGAFLDPTEQETAAQLRFKISSALIQLGQASRPAASAVANSWAIKYGVKTIPELPEADLPSILTQVEQSLDANKG